jgi:peptidoglycan-associated lipoprotein
MVVLSAIVLLLAPITTTNAKDARPLKVAGNYGSYGPRERAEELYLDGMEKLQAGRRTWAQRTFESLISRYPKTPAADRARRKLGDLYGDIARPAVRPNAPLMVPESAAPVRAGATGPKWDREMRRSAEFQAQLRVQAGDRVFFSSGSAALGSKARTALAAQARWLAQNRGFEATIEGHADEPGTDEQNLILSKQRAAAVRQRLVEEGVAPARLEIVARGRAQRVAVCSEAACRGQNRRVITIVFVRGTHKRLGAAPSASGSHVEKQSLRPARPVSAIDPLRRASLPR